MIVREQTFLGLRVPLQQTFISLIVCKAHVDNLSDTKLQISVIVLLHFPSNETIQETLIKREATASVIDNNFTAILMGVPSFNKKKVGLILWLGRTKDTVQMFSKNSWQCCFFSTWVKVPTKNFDFKPCKVLGMSSSNNYYRIFEHPELLLTWSNHSIYAIVKLRNPE